MESLTAGWEQVDIDPQPLAALHVLRVVEDPRASSADLARLIEADPALAARVMRLANSPYYGLSRRVSSASRAIVLLGFSAVRALAVGAAYTLLVDGRRPGPVGFWEHSVTSAIGASCVARIVDGPVTDAFSAGLLHDLGLLLGSGLGDHGQRGAAALAAWRFPDELVAAVASHHGEPEGTLARFVRAGEALASLVGPPFVDDGEAHDVDDALEACGVAGTRAPLLVGRVKGEAERMARFLDGAG